MSYRVVYLCSQCNSPLSYGQVMHSHGICPILWAVSEGTIVDTRKVAVPEIPGRGLRGLLERIGILQPRIPKNRHYSIKAMTNLFVPLLITVSTNSVTNSYPDARTIHTQVVEEHFICYTNAGTPITLRTNFLEREVIRREVRDENGQWRRAPMLPLNPQPPPLPLR